MNAKAVAQRICSARQTKGLTQEELAARANISPTHLGVIERGVKIPKLDTFVAICNALEISADELLQDVVDKSAESSSTELSKLLSGQTPETKQRIYKAVQALIEN